MVEKIVLLQIDATIARIILVYVIQGIIVSYFILLANRILKRRKQRINLIFGSFFICTIIGLILNMIYVLISNVVVVKILHFLSVFFVRFGLIFILIVNLIILESTIIFPVKRQNRYIIFYGVILFSGMLILTLLNHLSFDKDVPIWDRYPKWDPILFIYIFIVITALAIIPIFYTSFKIYYSFKTKELKKKWLSYLIGSLGLVIFNLYPIDILNLLTDIMEENIAIINIARTIVSIIGISVIFWISLMYYGIGSKLKKE